MGGRFKTWTQAVELQSLLWTTAENYKAWPCFIMLESRWPHRGIDWHGSWRLIRTLMYVGVKERVFSSWGTAWQIQRYGNSMGIQFYYRLILCRVKMSDTIIWEGKDFTYLECGVGRSRLWWCDNHGVEGVGGQALKNLEKGLANWVGCYVNGGCSLILEGERNS